MPFLFAAAEWFPEKEVLAYMEKLEGKVALITGASRGIGEGVAKVYAKYGAKLVLAARSKATETLAEQLRALGAEAMAVAVDVTDAASVRAGVESSYLTGAQIVIDGGSTLSETSVVGAG